jgi:glycosyltransferase involved in cell wall biosynthesis
MQSSIQLKIGIDCRMLDWGGVGRYTKGLIQGLSQIPTHHKFILICHSKDEIHLGKLNNFEIIETNLPVFSLRHIKAFSQLVNDLNVDVFHSPHFIYPWFYKGKGVATIHDLIPFKYPKTISFINRIKFILAIKATIRKADRIISVSNNTKKDIVDLLGCNNSKVTTIYEAVDENFRPLPQNEVSETLKKYRIDFDYFLYVGAYKPHKNIEGLVKAYNSLPDETKDRYKLVVIGKKDDRFPEVDLLIKKKKLTRHIIQIDNVEEAELVDIYNAAEIFIFPSFYEGFGLPPLEAMSCGTPIIASNTSSLPEILGQNALLIDPYNVNDLTEAIRFLLSDKDLKNNLKDKGLSHIKTFSWQKMAEETLAIYENVANSS